MIIRPKLVEVHYAAGAAAMSGTIGNSALTSQTVGTDQRAVRVTSNGHGIKADSDLVLSSLNSALYHMPSLRKVFAIAANTLDIYVGGDEAITLSTPAGTETWAAGYINRKIPWLLHGFKVHLSAADAAGETLTFTMDSAKNSAVTYWDTLLYSKVMTGVTDIVRFFSEPIPMAAGDAVKFAWTNTGTKTWGTEIWIQPLE